MSTLWIDRPLWEDDCKGALMVITKGAMMAKGLFGKVVGNYSAVLGCAVNIEEERRYKHGGE